MSDASIHLYSMAICPFVQRTRILLGHKGVLFEHTEMDPKAVQSDWFQRLNPMGKVPALEHGDVLVTEVGAICMYLADAFPAAGLAPLSSPSGAASSGLRSAKT